MLHTIWKGGSLRSWIAFGMAVAVLPLAVAALGGYWWLSRGVVSSFQDVAARQRNEIDPTQRLRLLLVQAETPLDDYMDDGDAREPAAYRALREQIESVFATVHQRMSRDAELQSQVARARDDWTAADRIAANALAVRRPPGDTTGEVLMDQFHGLDRSAVDKLGAVYDVLASDLRTDHDAALRDVDRSDWLAAIAALVSAMAIVIGVMIIGRVIAGSVERLVTGAERFAAGDREHRIDVQVPPELRQVAQEFNRMIGRIHQSEGVLADLARRDSLTLLLNRRAFDEHLAELFARQDRLGEPFALVVMDLDHFKAINDRFGHTVGDDVLRAAARTLGTPLRPFDRLFRTGGEEFAATLPGTDAMTARVVAERLREALAAHAVTLDGNDVAVTVSAGIAMATPDATSETLLKAADAALYRAKAGGRNRVEA
jgi:diguanylate cyclase (GGDEF)-like protein